jgi:hypothetical protein
MVPISIAFFQGGLEICEISETKDLYSVLQSLGLGFGYYGFHIYMPLFKGFEKNGGWQFYFFV